MRIQQRIGVRRGRDRWLRPVMILGSVIVVAAVAVGGVVIARNGNDAKLTPAHSSSPTPTSNPGQSDGFPAQGFFPFSNATDEAGWQQGYETGGHSPWISDPLAVAQSWVPYYLLQKHVDQVAAQQVSATTADITLGRTITGSGVHAVVNVHLVKFHKAWIVIGASAPDGQLTISSPAPGSSVTSPVTVTGPGFGVDERATVEVRDAATPALLGQAQTGMFGNGTQQWSAQVGFTPAKAAVGVIVVSIASPADGGVGEFTAQKVVFNTSPPSNAGSGFYGVVNGAIEHFTGGGKPEGVVPDSANYAAVSEVRRVGGMLYFTAGASTCPGQIRSIPTSGGTSTPLLTADNGYGITGFDISGDGRATYFESGCGGRAGNGKLVFQMPGGTDNAVEFPSLPPSITGDPVWESDGVHIDAFVRTGMSGYLGRYNSTTGTNPQPNKNACPGFDVNSGMPSALTTAPDGTLWFAVQTGTSMQVISCASGTPTVQMSVTTSDTPASLSVDSSGDVLLADVNGQVWNGTAGGAQTAISGSAITSVTW